VCLDIFPASINLLMGPNGSGKSTLVNCISGIYTPEQGKIFLEGVDITGKAPHEIVRLGIGRTFQIPAPFNALTVADNLLVCGHSNQGERFGTALVKNTWQEYEKSLVDEMLSILQVVGLEDKCDARAGELSGGQLKLLELGRLLMLGVKVMVVDEPVGGVNPLLAHEILSHIKNVRDKLGITCLMVEHRLDIVMRYVDYVWVLAGGRVLCSGTPGEVVKTKELYEVYLTKG